MVGIPKQYRFAPLAWFRRHPNFPRAIALILALVHVGALSNLWSFLHYPPKNTWQIFWIHQRSPSHLIPVLMLTSLTVVVGGFTVWIRPHLGFWILVIATLENLAFQIYSVYFDAARPAGMAVGVFSSPLGEFILLAIFLIGAFQPKDVYAKPPKVRRMLKRRLTSSDNNVEK